MGKRAARADTRGAATVRCAIYTRKSTEEGLEQAFNSLDAQREACTAFIESQKHEGWRALKAHYNDGGYSGAMLGRPTLQRLLGDVSEGRIDVVVAYKVDRLTRARSDFAKIVEVFDACGVSVVSVTQQFNTTTSMGRLTLNVLLSFAQFEREVTGKRIRDKIAASKKKGMWMGGLVPLGYDARDRKLVVNQAEAETVRRIFGHYAELGSVRSLKEELDATGVVSKVRRSESGRRWGGKPLSRGALYRMLQNRIYRGEIVHKEKSYPGEHDAIIPQDLWDKVRQTLAANRVERASSGRARSPSLRAGLLFDDQGERMTPSHAVKNGKRYRYYVSRPLTTPRTADCTGRRIPAGDIERIVPDRIRMFLSDSAEVFAAIEPHVHDAESQERLVDRAARLADRWRHMASAERRGILLRLGNRLRVPGAPLILPLPDLVRQRAAP